MLDDPLERMIGKTKLTTSQLAELSDAEWIIPNVLVRGMLHVFPAKYNTGKTTLFLYLFSPLIRKDGYNVIYLNADVSTPQAKLYGEFAESNGIELLLPGIAPGTSRYTIWQSLTDIVKSDNVYPDCVLIVDTLKKFCDVNNKTSVKTAMNLFRELTHKGMTVVLLHHTIKYENSDGEPVYEGTNDIASEPDNVVILKGEDNGDVKLVSTVIEKSRADFQPRSWEYHWFDETPVFKQIDYMDFKACELAQKRYQDDREAIEVISDAIKQGVHSVRAIISFCSGRSISERQVRKVLPRYKEKHGVAGLPELWKCTRLRQENNSDYYELLSVPPFGCEHSGHSVHTPNDDARY